MMMPNSRKCFIVSLFTSLSLISFYNKSSFRAGELTPPVKGTKQRESRRLEFVSYTSSTWEQLWLKNVDKWIRPEDGNETCRQLFTEQAHFVHDFLNLTCTTRFPPPYHNWCRFDDFVKPFYYDLSNRTSITLSFTPPNGLSNFEKKKKRKDRILPQPVVPAEQDEHVVSKFVFRDAVTGEEHVEYIEPLVSHLRFPLAGCPSFEDLEFIVTRSYIVPPSPRIRSSRRLRLHTNAKKSQASTTADHPHHDRYLYFDAGASSWSDGKGGPSLHYFTNMWLRHGINFNRIFAFEATTSAADFYKTVPKTWKTRTVYQQAYVSSRLEEDSPSTPFIPKFIQKHASIDDYVIFKLDIDSPRVEVANIEYLLQNNASGHLWIDELFWEHHIPQNPFMQKYWFPDGDLGDSWKDSDPTMRGSYNYFLGLRNLGIRAHSWI